MPPVAKGEREKLRDKTSRLEKGEMEIEGTIQYTPLIECNQRAKGAPKSQSDKRESQAQLLPGDLVDGQMYLRATNQSQRV